MPTSAERPDPAGTVYRHDVARSRLPRDPLMWAAVLIGAAGLLVGAFFVLSPGSGGPGGSGSTAVPAAATQPTAAPTPSAEQPAAPTIPATTPPTTAPTTVPPPQPTGPTVFRQVASGRCLGIDGDGEKAAAKLVDCTDDPRQRWLADSIGPGLVTLVNQASNMCLDVEGHSADDGAKLQQYPCHGEANQQWRLVPTAGGSVLLAALNSGRCAHPDAGRHDAGTDIRQITCVDAPDQQWLLG
ncbi:RICIN domain-containing protein [Salinispora arenicola]|uniref:RICIN domain-containing protein n=1 Tax=Salinispora arenicola TaxID=168697 RepID=UPI00036321BB|nr:RICIN domain-containing protein [Salinispora arenicola]